MYVVCSLNQRCVCSVCSVLVESTDLSVYDIEAKS